MASQGAKKFSDMNADAQSACSS